MRSIKKTVQRYHGRVMWEYWCIPPLCFYMHTCGRLLAPCWQTAIFLCSLCAGGHCRPASNLCNHAIQLSSAQRRCPHSLWCMEQQQPHMQRYLVSKFINLVWFCRQIITERALLKHDFWMTICDFIGRNQVLSPRNVLQTLIFVHCQPLLGWQARDKTNAARTIRSELNEQTLKHMIAFSMGVLPIKFPVQLFVM